MRKFFEKRKRQKKHDYILKNYGFSYLFCTFCHINMDDVGGGIFHGDHFGLCWDCVDKINKVNPNLIYDIKEAINESGIVSMIEKDGV